MAQFNVDLKILTRSCSFHGHFQTLGFAPTHSVECLFFFFLQSKRKAILLPGVSGFFFPWISSVKIKNSGGLLTQETLFIKDFSCALH